MSDPVQPEQGNRKMEGLKSERTTTEKKGIAEHEMFWCEYLDSHCLRAFGESLSCRQRVVYRPSILNLRTFVVDMRRNNEKICNSVWALFDLIYLYIKTTKRIRSNRDMESINETYLKNNAKEDQQKITCRFLINANTIQQKPRVPCIEVPVDYWNHQRDLRHITILSVLLAGCAC